MPGNTSLTPVTNASCLSETQQRTGFPICAAMSLALSNSRLTSPAALDSGAWARSQKGGQDRMKLRQSLDM